MKQPVRAALALVAVGSLFAGGWIIDRQRTASRSTLSGFFESQPAQVGSKVGGRVERIAVREGDAVRAGQTLVELDSASTAAQLAQRLAAAQEAAAAQALVDAGPRKEDVESGRQAYREASAALAEALAGARPEEIGQARARVRQAQAALDKAEAGPRPEEKRQAIAQAFAAKSKLDAAVRGLTPDEIAQYKDRLDSASSQAKLASQDYTRYAALFSQQAVTRQQLDTARANLSDASAREQEAKDAYANAVAGTPKEELDTLKYEYGAAQQALALLDAGTRPEDIAAARAERDAAVQALNLLLAGTRKEDVDAARARAAQAKSALDALIAGSRAQEKAQARAAALQARAAVAAALVDVDEHVIRAPCDGTVDRVLVADGDVVGVGTPLVRVDDPTDIWIRVYVPERLLARIRTGSHASLRVDGIDRAEDAVVESIAAQGEFTPANLQTPDERGKQVFEVRLRLASPDARVKAGMYATVRTIGGVTP